MHSAPPQTLADRWQLIELLGKGAMGEVWRGRHVVLGHEAAIKLMRPDAAADADLVSRFRREARIAAQVRHRNLVRVEDLGNAPDGRPFLVMELLRGESLQHLMDRVQKVERNTAVRFVAHVGAACDVAHAAGIVHRDLKPDNCFVVIDEDGIPQVKVLDFGVAKVADGVFKTTHGAMTGSHALLGTPVYMSPEQARGEADLDGRSDLWSLAVIAYEMLTGRLPFAAENISQLLYSILAAPIPPPSTFDPSIDARIDSWFAVALDRDRTRRFQSGRELATTFAQALGVTLGSASLTPPALPAAGSGVPFSPMGPTVAQPMSIPPQRPQHPGMSAATMAAPTSQLDVDTRRFAERPGSMRPPAYAAPSMPPPAYQPSYAPQASPAPQLLRTEAMPLVTPAMAQGFHPSQQPGMHGHSGFGPMPQYPHAPPTSGGSSRLGVWMLALGILAGMLVTATIVLAQRRANRRAAITQHQQANNVVIPTPVQLQTPPPTAIENRAPVATPDVVTGAAPQAPTPPTGSPHNSRTARPHASNESAPSHPAQTDDPPTPAATTHSTHAPPTGETPAGEQQFDGP